ncbi:MAG: rRNA pseudouridine synthase [Actinobacteria bacterium]|nr:rRNA pseudouridine synthase [Actinomycetota bacterium]
MEERLQKFMARAGAGSRRQCEKYITDGRVKVNGEVVAELGTKVNPTTDRVELDDKLLRLKEAHIYLALNKPPGFLTSVTDNFGRPTVIDLLGGISDRVFPVGRLDLDTEGLLLLTNDGELAFRLTHPRYKVKKRYITEVEGHPADSDLAMLRQGIMLEDGITAPAEVTILNRTKATSIVEITIHEGRKRQIRRMFQTVGHDVVMLKRIAIDNIILGDIPIGDCRHLTEAEIDKLYREVRLK